MEVDLEGDSKGDFRGDFEEDLGGDLLSISILICFSLPLKFDSLELDT